ncbi:MAG: hypothetical protein IPP17_17590 [Bacteroidetes bacterium]|nr:hypothetical protein [Bacteroidota bacterium]
MPALAKSARTPDPHNKAPTAKPKNISNYLLFINNYSPIIAKHLLIESNENATGYRNFQWFLDPIHRTRIQTGAMVISLVISTFINHDGSANFYRGMDLSELMAYSQWHYLAHGSLLVWLTQSLPVLSGRESDRQNQYHPSLQQGHGAIDLEDERHRPANRLRPCSRSCMQVDRSRNTCTLLLHAEGSEFHLAGILL